MKSLGHPSFGRVQIVDAGALPVIRPSLVGSVIMDRFESRRQVE